MKTYYRVAGREKSGSWVSWLGHEHKTIKEAQREIEDEKKDDKKRLIKGYCYRIVKVTESIVK